MKSLKLWLKLRYLQCRCVSLTRRRGDWDLKVDGHSAVLALRKHTLFVQRIAAWDLIHATFLDWHLQRTALMPNAAGTALVDVSVESFSEQR